MDNNTLHIAGRYFTNASKDPKGTHSGCGHAHTTRAGAEACLVAIKAALPAGHTTLLSTYPINGSRAVGLGMRLHDLPALKRKWAQDAI